MIRIKLVIVCCLLGITHLRAQITADFSASQVSGCAPLSVKLTDLSTGAPNYWSWGTSNGQISRLQSPTFVFSQPGTYSISLLVKNANGDFGSISKTDYITVSPSPAANFSANVNVSCVPANIQFKDLSIPGAVPIVSWSWDFGDGTTSTDQNPPHQYNQEGYYNLKLVVTNSGGCSSTATSPRFIRVIPGVKAGFNWSQTSISCSAPFDISFSNQTSGPGHMTYSWTLGNASTSTQVNPATTYPTSDPYTIHLSATSDLGCSDTITKTISFQSLDTPVIVGPDQACPNAPVSFSNGSNPAPMSSVWDFGDGNTSTQPNPDNTYAAIGTYTVTLTNTYATCVASATKTVQVVKNPSISFTADNRGACKAPFTVNFKDNTVGATGWLWDFGDGTTGTGQTPSHTYTDPGIYSVSEITTSTAGCKAGPATNARYIQIVSPSATLDATTLKGCTTIAIHPKATVIAPDGVASWSWTAPGAMPSSSTSATPAFTYSAEGHYDITLSLTTKGGCTFTQTFPQAVSIGQRVNPEFLPHDIVTCPSPPVTFTSTSPVDNYTWLFGDGDSSHTTVPVAMHKYRDTGYFNVTLFVTNNGCTLSYTDSNTIRINGPAAGFSFKIDCANRLHVDFTDTSKYDPAKGTPTFQWDFGDGTTAIGTSASHDYTALGKYPVRLIVTNPECADTTTTNINLDLVVPTFTVSPTEYCRRVPFRLQSTTDSTNLVEYTWQIGTATYIADTTSLNVSIPDTGVHNIVLTVKDVSGCPYTSAASSVLITGPTAKFTTDPLVGGCRNSPITMVDQSTTFRNTAISSWFFNYGDFTSTLYTTPPFTHTYTDTGTYTLGMIIKDAKGCVDTAVITSAVRITSPRAGFLVSDTLYCPDVPISFTDTSKGSSLTYSWDFGDGSTSGAPNPTHVFATNDRYYDVKLTVTDNIGCADSSVKSKYIHIEKPIASFDLQDSTAICFPLEAMFTPAGKYYDSLYWDFGDGITSTLDTTSHFYNAYGPAANNYAYVAKLVLQNSGGCRDSAMRNIYIYNPGAVTKLTFSPIAACDSIRATFNLIPPPYTKYTLYFGDGTADSTGNTSPVHLYDLPSSYSPQLGMIDSTGCIVGITNGSLKVLGATPFFSKSQKAFCDTGTVTFHSIFPIPSNDGLTSLTWDFGDGSALVSGTPTGAPDDPLLDQEHFYSQKGQITINLKATTNNGCVEAYSDTVRVWQTPDPVVTSDGPYCAGLIQFHGNLTTPDIDSIYWSWDFGSGVTSTAKDPLLNFPSGNFTAHLKASVAFGCSDTASQSILVNPLPEIKGPKEVTMPIGIPTPLPFAYSPNVVTWAWSPGSYLDCTDCPNPMATPTFATTYIIRVVDANNCVNQDTILVTPICSEENYFVPNTFSPNNDGVNDYFYPRGKGLYNIQSMRIFNRWGQLLFERKNFPANTASNGWDGTTSGKPAQADSYVYIIEVVCNNAQTIQLHGNVTLIR